MAEREKRKSETDEILTEFYGDVDLDGQIPRISAGGAFDFRDDFGPLSFSVVFADRLPRTRATGKEKHAKQPGALIMQALLKDNKLLSDISSHPYEPGTILEILRNQNRVGYLADELLEMIEGGDINAIETSKALESFIVWISSQPSSFLHFGPRNAGTIAIEIPDQNCVAEIAGANIDDFIVVVRSDAVPEQIRAIEEIRSSEVVGKRASIPQLMELFRMKGIDTILTEIKILEIKLGSKTQYGPRHIRHERQATAYLAVTREAVKQGPREAAIQPLLQFDTEVLPIPITAKLIYFNSGGCEEVEIEGGNARLDMELIQLAAKESIIASNGQMVATKERTKIIESCLESGQISLKDLFSMFSQAEWLQLYDEGVILTPLFQPGSSDINWVLFVPLRSNEVIVIDPNTRQEFGRWKIVNAKGAQVREEMPWKVFNKARKSLVIDKRFEEVPFIQNPKPIEELPELITRIANKLGHNLQYPDNRYSSACLAYTSNRGIPLDFAIRYGLGCTNERDHDLAVIDAVGDEAIETRLQLGLARYGLWTREMPVLRAGFVGLPLYDLERLVRGNLEIIGWAGRSIFRKQLHCGIVPPEIKVEGRPFKIVLGDPIKAQKIYICEGVFDSLSMMHMLDQCESSDLHCVIGNIDVFPERTLQILGSLQGKTVITVFDRDKFGARANDLAVKAGAIDFWGKLQALLPDLPNPDQLKDVNDLLTHLKRTYTEKDLTQVFTGVANV